VTLDHVNSLPLGPFVGRLGFLFEHSPWVAERTWQQRPFATIEALHAALVNQVERAAPEEKLALVRAHPDLGARAKMSDASKGEQAGAGLDRMPPDQYDLLQRRNAAYRQKFGFPFLYAVKGSTSQAILEALARRLEAAPDAEVQEALRQVCRIAWYRLEALMEEGD
jgi:2-oxo-4-hydroxy-4-carboxy-5-ureidoimidazoline decarboxylase